MVTVLVAKQIKQGRQIKQGIAPLTLLFLFLLSLLILLPSAAAQPFTGDVGNVGNAVMGIFEPIFGANLLESANFAFWAKFLIWILLFAVFYWVFRMLFKEHKNIAVTVAAVISAISALGMPESMLRGVVESYTLFSTFIIYIAPIAGTLFLIQKFFGEENRFNRIIKAVLFFLLAALLTHFTAAMQNAGIPSFNYTTGLAAFAVSVCILAGIYNIIRAIFSGPAGQAPVWPFGAGAGATPAAPAHPGPVAPPPDFTTQLNQLQAAIARYIQLREHNLRIPAMRDILNARHARGAGGGAYPYPYPYPAPAAAAAINWAPYTVAWNALVAQDGTIRGIIRLLQRHPDFARITATDHARFDTLVATDYANALLDTTTLLNDFAFNFTHANASPW